MSTLTLFAVVLAALLPLLVRDLKRADMRRRRREWLRTNPQAQRLARQVEALQRQIGTAMLPALRQVGAAAAQAATAMQRLQTAMTREETR